MRVPLLLPYNIDFYKLLIAISQPDAVHKKLKEKKGQRRENKLRKFAKFQQRPFLTSEGPCDAINV